MSVPAQTMPEVPRGGDFGPGPMPGSFSLVADELHSRRVADLGCNTGYYLRRSGPGSRGLDVSERNVAACKEQGLSCDLHDLNRLPLPLPDGAFDVVLLSHVLEHVHAPIRLLMEANRILAPGGQVVIGLPIEDSLYSRLRMNYYGGPEGHIYSFSRRNLTKLLSIAGFGGPRFVCHLPVIGFRPWPRLNRMLSRLPLALLYQVSGAYWCLAGKIAAPQPDAGFSSYFRES